MDFLHLIVDSLAGILLAVRLLLVINRREGPIINLQSFTYTFIMLLDYDSGRSKWCRLCKQASVILTKYESNVFFCFCNVCFIMWHKTNFN